jgi:hypothetical protein
MRAYRQRKTGTLSTDPTSREVVFDAKDGERTNLSIIRSVEVGGRGNDIVNTWIEVHFGDASTPSTVYINDGGWLGWRPMLTSSNLRIARSLNALSAQSQT